SSRFLFCPCSVHFPYLHSFPTRRSSDLMNRAARGDPLSPHSAILLLGTRETLVTGHDAPDRLVPARRRTRRSASTSAPAAWCPRSEEHTSELQSLAYLVCRLLLEKKKLT